MKAITDRLKTQTAWNIIGIAIVLILVSLGYWWAMMPEDLLARAFRARFIAGESIAVSLLLFPWCLLCPWFGRKAGGE